MPFSEITFLDGLRVEFRDTNNRTYLTVWRQRNGRYQNRKGTEHDLPTWRRIAADQ